MTMRRSRREIPAASQRGLEQHTFALGIAVLAVAVLATVVSVLAINGIPFSNPYHLRAIVPADAPIVRHGDEVLVAGQRVGQVRHVDVTGAGRRLDMDIDRGRVGRDARATVRLRGLAGAVYIDLARGDTSHPAPDHYTIPLRATGTNTQLTAVVAAFDRESRAALGRTLTAYGGGLAGHGRDLNAVLADLPPLVARGGPVLRSFTPQPGAFSDVLDKMHRTVRGFGGQQRGDLAGTLAAGDRTFGALAAVRTALGSTLDRLRPFSDSARDVLPLADPLLADATSAVRDLRPGVRALARALPRLDTLLGRRAQLAELSRLAAAARPVLTAARPVLLAAEPGAASLAPLAGALEPFAAYAAPYAHDIAAGPHGFTTWGGFKYGDGQAAGARAVRFAPVFTCMRARDPYPAPGVAESERSPCR